MNHSPNSLLVKYPMSKGSIVGSILTAILILMSMILIPSYNIFILSLQLFCIALCIINIALTIWRGRKKPHHFILDSNQIIAGDTAFELDAIDKIVIKGSSIGIKLKQKRVVPLNLCFTLMDETDGLQILKKWAEHQQVKVKYGSFLRWL